MTVGRAAGKIVTKQQGTLDVLSYTLPLSQDSTVLAIEARVQALEASSASGNQKIVAGTGLSGGGNTDTVTVSFDVAWGDARYARVGETRDTDSRAYAWFLC